MNRAAFFDAVRAPLFGGRLSRSLVGRIESVLGYWDTEHPTADPRWLAYVLATAHHETDATFIPLREYSRGRGKPYGRPDPQNGHVYYGRGLVQITHRENYRKLSPVVGVNLVAEPDRALEMPIAVKILCHGMVVGIFTGRRLASYFNDTMESWVRARRIINGLDCAEKIAGYGRTFHAAIAQAERA